jgi:hypothetical protein
MKKTALLMMMLMLGTGTAVPAADFNGDGIGDIAVFRATSGLWAVRGVTRLYFGSTGDNPVPGDYRGLGRDTAAIYRDSSGLWAVRGVTRVYFGNGSDDPRPGDYNGDGIYDIGVFRKSSGLWAVRDVTRLYFGSSADMAVPPGEIRSGLPRTGQTMIYRGGDDGWYQVGAPFLYQTFIYPLSDWVTVDRRTGLMWAKYGDGEGCNYGQQTDWISAIDWSNNLVFAGYNDWRVPNIKELQSIVDYGKHDPAIDTTYFASTKDWYWSSSTYDVDHLQAWRVNFYDGYVLTKLRPLIDMSGRSGEAECLTHDGPALSAFQQRLDRGRRGGPGRRR